MKKNRPITHPVEALPHTPIYKIHRYFARRPYSVFNYLIEQYSNEGDIVLDPFCGGGVTVIEGLILRRKVIGVDLNPMATFITKIEVSDMDLQKFQEVFLRIERNIKNEINNFYLTVCPKCKEKIPAEWTEWSYLFRCPYCRKIVKISETKKVGSGKYLCSHCHRNFHITEAKRIGEVPIKIKLKCNCGFKGEKTSEKYDLKKIEWIKDNFRKIVNEKKLWFPKDKIPIAQETKRLVDKNFIYFHQLFTQRNLLSLSILLKEIQNIDEKKIQNLMKLLFTATVDYASRISRVVQGQGREITTHTFWPPDLPCENNVWFVFSKRFKATLKAKQYSEREIGSYYKEAQSFRDLKSKNATGWILSQSSNNLPLPNKSVDTVITDPPYGGNVNYTELSDFWAIWIKNSLGIKKDKLIDYKDEIIINKYQNKGMQEYQNLLHEIFRECHRVLKPGGWMVLTFHNRNFEVWKTLHLAAQEAGFELPSKGIMYQPPIQAYTPTLHQRSAGAMLGDFIVSFKRSKRPFPSLKTREKITPQEENEIVEEAKRAIEYHGGASESVIMTGLIPFLLKTGLLHKLGKEYLAPYLSKHSFIEKGGVWYLPEHIDQKTGKVRALDFIPAEMKIEELIRSLLREKEKKHEIATMDDLLRAVYENLINGTTPIPYEIDTALKRICERVPIAKSHRYGFRLKESVRGQMTFEDLEAEVRKTEERDLFGEPVIIPSEKETSLHNSIISYLARIGHDKGYDIHIGETEQRKRKIFKDISVPMSSNVLYGIGFDTFNLIKEIDILWLKGRTITSAFEIATSITTAEKAVNTRFRNLLANTGFNLKTQLYLIVLNKDIAKASEIINSEANRREGIATKIKCFSTSHLNNQIV